MIRLYDPKHGIVTQKDDTEARVIHGAYQLMRRGLDFTEWAYKPLAEIDAKLAELLKTDEEKSAKKKPEKKPKFDKEAFEKWAKADARYLELAEKAKAIVNVDDRRKFLADEGAKLVKTLKSEFVAKAA